MKIDDKEVQLQKEVEEQNKQIKKQKLERWPHTLNKSGIKKRISL